jgi:MFS family permease
MAQMERGAYVRMLSAAYAAMFLIRVAFGITVVTFAAYVSPENDLIYSLVVAASPFTELVTVVFAGVLIDRYGRKGILIAGLALGAISLYGLALTTEPLFLTLINALHGVAAAFILVTTLAIIATYAPAQRRGREMGLFNLANLFGWIAGFVLGSLLSDLFRGRLEYTFVIAGALATLGLLYANRMLVLPEESPGEDARKPTNVRDLVKAVGNKDVLLLTLPWLIVFTLIGALVAFFPRVAQSLEISGARTSLAILVVGVLLLGSQLFWGRLADRYGREAIMLVGGLGFAALMGVIMLGFFETASEDPRVIFANVMSHWFLMIFCLAFALAFAPAGLAAIADEAKEGAEGTTMSAYSLTLSAGFILGPPVLGAISRDFGGTGMVLFFAALAAALLGMVLTRFIQTRVARRAQPEAGRVG